MVQTRALATLGIALAGTVFWPAGSVPAEKSAPVANANQTTFDQQLFWRTAKVYCDSCHIGPKASAKLNLAALDLAHLDLNGETWEKILRKLRNREMPPLGVPRPDTATYDRLVASIEAERDRVGQINPDPGRPTLHRLNRTEYTNAVRDLLALDVDLAELLPPDDAGYGFDNIGDVLSVSPVLMEGYLSAARKISRSAIGDREATPVSTNYELPRFLIQNERMGDDLPLGSRGGMAVRYNFPLDAEYVLRIRLQKNGYTYTLGTAHERQIDVRIDGQKIKQFIVGGDYKGTRPVQPSSFGQGVYERYLINADQNLELRFPAKAGSHLVQVTFPDNLAEPEGVYQPPITDYSYALSYGRADMEPAVAGLTIGGPYASKGLGETPSRARIFVCKPASASEEEACAERILSTLARRAFRRPVTDSDLEDVMTFYDSGRSAGTFEDGIESTLRRILVDPEFLFRIERDPPQVAPGTAYRISDLELASRLSFFLWSSIPDDELLDLAQRGQLNDPATLEAQVHRMLGDQRANALVKNFAGQWLYLRNLEKIWPNPDTFPDFDGNLRDSFQKESELFFQSILTEDRSVLDLIKADYTFLNERLARHYGIPNVYGSHFRRVALTDDNRKGFLGQGSILTVTSYATRTAPSIRGKWLLENILGTPPPPPPPNVPDLALKPAGDGKAMTMREQMEAHRVNPGCASCHKFMDPLGFALENFDATGKWRTMEAGSKINASGVTPDGYPLNGPADLREYIVSRPNQFVNTVTEKLLTYALGRGVESYDYPVIRKIVKDSAAVDYKWSSLVVAIVKSTPFQMRRYSGAMMVITKKALHRRTVLRGLGTTLALPLLDAMVPALAKAQATKAPTRLSIAYVPNGIMMDRWTPDTVGTNFKLKPIMEPLAAFQDRMLVISGLSHNHGGRALQGENTGDHARAGASYLSGVHPRKTEGADTLAGISMDQIAARQIGSENQFASLELGVDSPELLGQCEAGYSCAYMNSICWRTPSTPMPMENRPRVVFERLFGDAESTEPAVRLARIQQDRSILDSVTKKANSLKADLGATDQRKVAEYLDAVRDVERRVQLVEKQVDRKLPKLERPAGVPETFTEHARMMFDLQVLAYQTDLTRVITFMLGREFGGRTYQEIGIPEGYHALTHHQYNPEKISKVVQIQIYHAKHVAYFLEKLRSTPDGDGSLLDHMMVLYGGALSDGNSHLHDNLPTMLIGGASGQLKGGRHIRLAKETPMANLLLTMLDMLGVQHKSLGDSTSPLSVA